MLGQVENLIYVFCIICILVFSLNLLKKIGVENLIKRFLKTPLKLMGISSKIEEGHPFNLELLSDPKVSIPLTALGIMVLVVNFIKQKFFTSKI